MKTETVTKAMQTEREATIWRYMDLSRFVSMLASHKMWFAKASTFKDDPYEGYSKVKCFEVAADDAPISPERFTALLREKFSQISAEYCRNAGEHLYVNSWCLGLTESMAMWEIYGARGCGIAVKSSWSRYEEAAKFDVDRSHVHFGPVQYHESIESTAEIERDFSKGPTPVPGPKLREEILKLAFHKRSCYEYEKEWRAALYQDLRPESGICVEFDLERLIEAVYVGPRAQSYVIDAVQAVLDKFFPAKLLLRRSVLLYRPAEVPAVPSN